IKGLVIFDGAWAQAKTLWWRNAWVLKARRLALSPKRRSLYGELRREPRREGLSTIEAIGLTLATLEGRPEIEAGLRDGFATMLARYRSGVESGKVTAQAPKPGGDRRRKWRGKRG
ncbi:MAG: DTW domain-containing protein, partial [Rhodoblastus sp.]